MKYIVDLNGERHEVDLATPDLHAHLANVAGTPVHLVTIGDQVHRVIVRKGESKGQYTLWIDGYRFEAEALDERTRAIRDLSAKSADATGPAPLKAPMPGLIVRVNVKVGDQVQLGQGLIVMEAMKMENELRASAPGVVKSVKTAPGSTVDKGALLIELE